jgi:hypothetical protein
LAIWKCWQKSKNDVNKAKYLEISRECRQAIYEHVTAKERALLDTNNLGQFYKYVNRKLATKSGIGVLKDNNGANVFDPADQANLFSEFFSSTLITDDGLLPAFPSRVPANTSLCYIPFDQDRVLKALNKLRPGTAGGPDGLQPCFLKRISKYIAHPLSVMFEQFFLNSYVPPIWKKAYVRPIIKSGSASLTSNYRPISLTCTCSKLMESIVSRDMLEYLLDNGLISDQQYGFIPKRSTCSQLLESFQDWVLELSDKRSVDIVYLDFSKAFDSISHGKLLHKLSSYGFKYELLDWIKSFLENREQCVLIDDHRSEYRPVTSGVVQGSQIGPLLFIIFINDIVDLVDKPAVCKLFADDVKLYSNIQYPFGNSLQITLQKIHDWSCRWQMKINPSKSSTMQLGGKRTDTEYTINDITIPLVHHVKDLGLVYDSSLKFDDYISNVTVRAYQRIGLIFRGFISKNTELLKRAYLTYVRPILEYCTCIWSPYLLKDIHKLENVQRYFTRRLFPRYTYTYQERLALLKIESLESRRLKFDIKMYFKIINNLVNVDSSKFFMFASIDSGTRGHCYKLRKRLFCSNRLFNSFSNRAVDCWNSLPEEMVGLKSYVAFSRKLRDLELTKFLKGMS